MGVTRNVHIVPIEHSLSDLFIYLTQLLDNQSNERSRDRVHRIREMVSQAMDAQSDTELAALVLLTRNQELERQIEFYKEILKRAEHILEKDKRLAEDVANYEKYNNLKPILKAKNEIN